VYEYFSVSPLLLLFTTHFFISLSAKKSIVLTYDFSPSLPPSAFESLFLKPLFLQTMLENGSLRLLFKLRRNRVDILVFQKFKMREAIR
jgi:hypothetical protein